MSRWVYSFSLSILAAVAPVLAANGPSPSAKVTQPAVSAPSAAPHPALQPVTTAGNTLLPQKPVLIARAPFDTVWNSTLLAANSQAMGLQSTRRAAGSHIHWAIAGAAVGAIVGAIADDPLRDALIGGVAGFGASYVMRR